MNEEAFMKLVNDNNADWVTSINVKINYKGMRGQ